MTAPKLTAPAPVWTSTEKLTSYCDGALDRARALRVALKKPVEGPRTMANTVQTYHRMSIELDNAMGWAALHFQVHPDEATRKAAGGCKERISAFTNDVNLDRDLYDALAAVDMSGTDAQTQRFAERVKRDFRRSGVDKDDATRTRLKEIHAEIVKLGQQYQSNILKDVRKITVDEAALKGMPEDWIAAHKPKQGEPFVVTTDYPDFFPFQTYARDSAKRQELYTLFMGRGYPANKPIMAQLLKLRHEYATTLGYKNWAAYNTETKMVKTSEAVDAFLKELVTIARPRSVKDLAELLEAKKALEPNATTVEVWDRFFYQARVKQEKYGFDAKAVRNYFQYNAVKAGILALYSELFSVTFVPLPDEPVWHPAVEAYSLEADGKPIARFYLDMHPRPGKYKHAAMFGIRTGLKDGQLPLASLVCNFPEPKGGSPALMEHTQVITFFHEFGHLLHHLLAAEAKWINLGGINVEWDFVEAPSQILEEWGWSAEVLSRFARHVETKEPIPNELVAKMRASDEFGKGAAVMRQLFYAAYSYYLHVQDPASLDLDAYSDDIYERFSPYPRLEGGRVYANFGHLIGYSSGYYTYQWSLVIAKDLFTRFQKAGMMDATAARDYRQKILEPGGMRDAADLVKDFLGRDYNLDAYKAWLTD